MGQVMKDAAFSLAEAKFASTADFNPNVLQSVTTSRIKYKTKMDNIAGKNNISSCFVDNYFLMLNFLNIIHINFLLFILILNFVS